MVNRGICGFLPYSTMGGAGCTLAIFFFCFILGQFIIPSGSFAAEKGKDQIVAVETGKYQIVAGSGDNAYLLDTETGAAWVLTYRTMATGREPVAIPYKFIGISPKNRTDFLIEASPAAPSTMQGRDK